MNVDKGPNQFNKDDERKYLLGVKMTKERFFKVTNTLYIF